MLGSLQQLELLNIPVENTISQSITDLEYPILVLELQLAMLTDPHRPEQYEQREQVKYAIGVLRAVEVP